MRRMLTLCFWLWSLVGAALNFYQLIQAHRLVEIGVGTSAAAIMDVCFWTAGMIMLGLGAALARGDPMPIRVTSENAELERGWTELFGAFLISLVMFVVVTGVLVIWVIVISNRRFTSIGNERVRADARRFDGTVARHCGA